MPAATREELDRKLATALAEILVRAIRAENSKPARDGREAA